jgi:hypothetical protein
MRPAYAALRRGSLRIHYVQRRLVGVAGNAPVVASNSLFVTSDLQSGGWINSHGGPTQVVVAGVGVAPTEAELMRLA